MPTSLHTQLSECRSILARERDALNAARANVDTLRAENARLRAALEAWLAADALTPGDCYDTHGNPNANWGRVDSAKNAARAALTR